MSDENVLKIPFKESLTDIISTKKTFPKYTTQIINLANQNCQGTRPKMVGQMSELIQECPYKTFDGWKKWYLKKYPSSIENATEKIWGAIESLKEAIEKIDKAMVKSWVDDLVLVKTAEGLIIQEMILKKLAEKYNLKYQLANKEQESKGIDGYIGKIPISIKPKSYESKKTTVRDKIEVQIVYYKKTDKYLTIYYDDISNNSA